MGSEHEPGKRVQDLPEVRALAEKLARLREEAGLSQNALAARTTYDKGQVSRMMRGISPPTWEEFVLKLVAAVEERRGAPMAEEELQQLRVLFDQAVFARSPNRGLRNVKKSMDELSQRNRVLQNRLSALATLGALALVIFLTVWSRDAYRGITGASGDMPEEVIECSAASGSGALCLASEWRWSLRGGEAEESIEIVFDVQTRGDTLELDGDLRLEADCAAAVRWSVIAQPVDFAAGAGTLTPNDHPDLYAPIHRDAQTVTFTAQRTDSRPCAATLIWERPGPLTGTRISPG